MKLTSEKIESAPVKYKRMLSSEKEAVVYLHTEGYDKTVPKGKVLKLRNLNIPDGKGKLHQIRKLHQFV